MKWRKALEKLPPVGMDCNLKINNVPFSGRYWDAESEHMSHLSYEHFNVAGKSILSVSNFHIIEWLDESACIPSSSVTGEEGHTPRQEFPQSPSDILKKYSDTRFNISMPFNWDMLYKAMEDYANQFKTNPVIITNISNVEDEKFMPPDNGDICWEVGSKTFTRKEVAYLLYTQRAMISNDLKYHCGDNLTNEMFEILDNPRKPTY